MIYEFAVEPNLVVNWALGGIGRFARQFGLDQRRIVSDFPKDWKGQVVGEFYKRFGYDDSSLEFQNAQPNLEAYLQLLTESMVYRDVSIHQDADWVKEAEIEHARSPFYSIFVSAIPPAAMSTFVTEKTTEDVHNTNWWLPTISLTEKTPKGIASALRPLLRVSKRIILVDPYFDASKQRFRDTVAEVVRQAAEAPRSVRQPLTITIVTGVERDRWETSDEEAAKAAKELERQASKYRESLAPLGVALSLVILKNIPEADPLHNRFVITDVGGVLVPYGIDGDDRRPGHPTQDDLTPMFRGQYEARWNQYVLLKGVKVVAGPIIL